MVNYFFFFIFCFRRKQGKNSKNIYVIKNKSGAFVEQHSTNSKELNYVVTTIEGTQHYTESEIRVLRERFKGTWGEQGFKVYKIEYNLIEI